MFICCQFAKILFFWELTINGYEFNAFLHFMGI